MRPVKIMFRGDRASFLPHYVKERERESEVMNDIQSYLPFIDARTPRRAVKEVGCLSYNTL